MARVKVEKNFSPSQAAVFLRELADAIECGEGCVLEECGISATDLHKLKIRFEREPSGELALRFKVSGRSPETEEPQSPGHSQSFSKPAKPDSYKKLKKRLKQSFNAVGLGLRDNEPPAPEVLAAFFADSEELTRQPGFGDEYYQAYESAVRGMREAAKSRDLDLLRQRFAEAGRVVKECHARYK